jgi:hypothetical protein
MHKLMVGIVAGVLAMSAVARADIPQPGKKYHHIRPPSEKGKGKGTKSAGGHHK